MSGDAAAIAANYRRGLAEVGETVTVRRYVVSAGSRTVQEALVLARPLSGTMHDVIRAQQTDSKLILLADDLTAANTITLPLVHGDRIVLRGKVLNIQDVDDNTIRVGGTLIAIVVTVRG